MTVSTVAQRDMSKLVSSVAYDTRKALDDMLLGKHQFSFGNRSVQCQPIDTLRWITETIPDDPRAQNIRNIMVSAVSDSESSQGSSAVICAVSLAALLRISEQDLIKENVASDLRLISASSRRSSSEEIISTMGALDRDPVSIKIARSAILGCSSNAAIQITKGSVKTSIKKSRGYKFPTQISDVFLTTSGAASARTLRGARALVVDGFIESMSEIDGIVRMSHGSKSPLVIISRGYSPDVLNTLGVNYSHGHLTVVPLTVPFDELGVNLINDIGIVFRSNIVSSTKGELVSSRQWNDLHEIDEVRIIFSSGEVIVSDEGCRNLVRSHRKILRLRRKESDTDAQRELYDRRLSCLMGDGIVIDFGEDLKDLIGIYTDRMNSHVRNYRAGSRYGLVRIDDCVKKVKSPIVRVILNKLGSISDTYTTMSLLSGIQSSLSCENYMRQIGGIIYSDRSNSRM